MSEKKKDYFDKYENQRIDQIYKYDQKGFNLLKENNTNIRNILLVEGAILAFLISFAEKIFILKNPFISLIFLISTVSFLISVFIYSIGLKNIMMNTFSSFNSSRQRYFDAISKIKELLLSDISDEEVYKEINKIRSVMIDQKKDKDYIIENEYWPSKFFKWVPLKIQKTIQWLKEKEYSFDYSKRWSRFHSNLANYTFMLGVLSTASLFIAYFLLIH